MRRRDDGFDRIPAHILDRGQAEADGVSRRREIHVGDIDVGRQDRDAHVAAFVDVLHDLVGVAGFRRQQRGHEVHADSAPSDRR